MPAPPCGRPPRSGRGRRAFEPTSRAVDAFSGYASDSRGDGGSHDAFDGMTTHRRLPSGGDRSRTRAIVLAPAAVMGSAAALLAGYLWFLRRSRRSRSAEDGGV